MHPVIKRWAFLLSSTSVMVYFSEKMYWYVQGYSYLELILFYLFASYSVFWAIDHFKINDVWGLALAGILYPLFVEGVFTGIITADITGIMLSYFVGWHTTLAVLIGWFWHRKLLIERRTRTIILSSVLLGLLLGFWATVYWLPENINDPELSPENGFHSGKWLLIDYALLQLYLGAIYIFSHFILSKTWIERFQPSKWENYTILSLVLLLSLIQALSSSFFILWLIFLYAIVLLALRKYSQGHSEVTVLEQLAGEVRVRDILLLSLINLSAIVAYALVDAIELSEEVIRKLFLNGIVGIQVIYGAGILLYSIIRVWKRKDRTISQTE
ncbi:MAG: hypothetical protein D6732_02065 [Methanobacteriota archaeon]|nr:MAG: hypothetical protein D6732_02065 [Euryarchaeota archaeon]